MKFIRFFFFLGIICFSKNTMSQSFIKDDLLGVWRWGSHETDLTLTFEKDSVLISRENKHIDTLLYSLESTANGYILSKIFRSNPVHPYMMMYRLRVLYKDQIKLSSYQNMYFDSQSISWKKDLGGDQVYEFYELKRVK
jgi:hypothetical protein